MDARRVAIFIFPGVEELDFVGVYEVLAGTRDMIEQNEIQVDVPLEVEVIATQDLIECANGLLVRPHRVTDDLQSYELVVLPGGRGVRELMKDVRFLSLQRRILFPQSAAVRLFWLLQESWRGRGRRPTPTILMNSDSSVRSSMKEWSKMAM